MEHNNQTISILEQLAQSVAETFHLSTIEAVSAVATSTTAKLIVENRDKTYNLANEKDSIITELKMAKTI